MEKRARTQYHRTVDEAYEPIGDKLKALEKALTNKPPKEAAQIFRKAEKLFNRITGASHVKSRFSRVRRDLSRSKPNTERAAKSLAQGLERYTAELTCGRCASKDLLPDLTGYEAVVRYNMGLRSQPRLNSIQAARISSCLSVHRDISLNF